jgi:hypothetical protein
MKTVFFGPFVGEFGWELLFWQGWVRDVARTVFKDYHKIVSSFPGRYPFYPDADEFWPHPDWLLAENYSPNGYITDWWKNRLPKGNIVKHKYKWGIRSYYQSLEVHADKPDSSSKILNLFNSYKKRLPKDTIYFAPFLLNRCPKYGITFGAEIADHPLDASDLKLKIIDFEFQLLEKFSPTPKAEKIFSSIAKTDKIIAIFPRRRDYRRPDKNWKKEKYDYLIKMLQAKFKGYTIAILGEPGGAFYSEGVPHGCLDLINLDPGLRLDIQIAAIKQAVLSIGSMSGALIFALACGCPTLTFGYTTQMKRYHRENYLGTRFVYYPDMNPEPKIVLQLAEGMIDQRIPPKEQADWNPLNYFGPVHKIRTKVLQYLKEIR